MKQGVTIPALALGLAVSSAHAEAGDELTLIVSRGDDSATYYLSMPADEITPILATDPALLFSEDGRVPIDQFRLAGSFDLADDLFANITGSINETAFEFEAMSMMVHPTETPLPFAAPWDAYTAISVCSVDYGSDQLVPGALQIYYGGFTDQVAGDAPMKIHFPQTGRDARQIVIHSYENGRLVGTDVETIADGGTLVIETSGKILLPAWLTSVGFWVGLIGILLGTFAVLRLRGVSTKTNSVTT